MEHPNLSAIEVALRRERELLATTAADMRHKLGEVESDIGRIDAATAALSTAASKSSGKKKPPREGGKRSISAVSKGKVIQYMQSVLEPGVALQEQELKSRVEKLAQSDGYSRLGIGMRIKDACNDSRFTSTSEGIRLSLQGRANQAISPSE